MCWRGQRSMEVCGNHVTAISRDSHLRERCIHAAHGSRGAMFWNSILGKSGVVLSGHWNIVRIIGFWCQRSSAFWCDVGKVLVKTISFAVPGTRVVLHKVSFARALPLACVDECITCRSKYLQHLEYCIDSYWPMLIWALLKPFLNHSHCKVLGHRSLQRCVFPGKFFFQKRALLALQFLGGSVPYQDKMTYIWYIYIYMYTYIPYICILAYTLYLALWGVSLCVLIWMLESTARRSSHRQLSFQGAFRW